MTDTRSHSRRRWSLLAAAVAIVLHGVVGFPTLPGQDGNYAVAQAECDAQCWAILAYLTDQGLSQQDIECGRRRVVGVGGLPAWPHRGESSGRMIDPSQDQFDSITEPVAEITLQNRVDT